MATPFDVKLGQLPADERVEIDRLLREGSREWWHSDEGDGLAFHLLLAVAAVAGAVASIYDISISDPEFGAAGVDLGVLGLTLSLGILALLPWRFLVLHGRHGWLVTSFGYLRVRGPSLRLVRWPDIIKVERRVIGSGRGKFVMNLLTTPKGTLECDTSIFFTEIKRRIPTTATVQE